MSAEKSGDGIAVRHRISNAVTLIEFSSRLEELAAACAELAHQACVELIDQCADWCVQLAEREEEKAGLFEQANVIGDVRTET